jgi:uncharacterized membrane protein YkvA (DUF1232 family)
MRVARCGPGVRPGRVTRRSWKSPRGRTSLKVQLKSQVRRNKPWEIVRYMIQMPSFARLFRFLLADKRVGWFPKLFLGAVVALIISPIDLNHYLPVLGPIDDLAIFLIGCRIFLHLCPKQIVAEHVSSVDGSGRWSPFSA